MPDAGQPPAGEPQSISFPADELQFRSFLEMLPAGAYTCDASGLITFYNQHAVELWGRAPKLNDPVDRFCGSFKLFTPDGSPLAHSECWMALALKNGTPFIGQRIVIERPDGSRIAALAHANPLRSEAGEVIGAINVLMDISDRWRAEEAQSRLAAIVESSIDGVISKSLQGVITSWNVGAEHLFGYSAEEAIGRSIKMLIPPERHDEESYILEQIRRGQRIDHYETQRITKDGHRIDVSLAISPVRDSTGTIIGASKVARDITAQKRAALALGESERRFVQFMQHLPGLAWIKDLEGRYVFVNEAAEKAFQKRRDELYGKRDDEVFPPHIANQFRENDREVLRGSAGEQVVEALEHEDGVHHSIVSKFPIPGPSGEPALVGGIAIDITERKKAEEALVAVKDELAQQLADLRRLHGMSMRLSTTLELKPIMQEALHTAVAIEGVNLGILSLCDHEKNELRVGASVGFDEPFLALADHVPLGSAACGTCYRERQRIVIEDVEIDPSFAPYRELARQANFRAVHSTPLITRSGKIVGVLSTHSRQPYRPSDRTMHLIDLCARQAADYIENAQLYLELRDADRRKDEFLATLAHELRNPLAPICNSLHLLRLSDDLTPAVQHVREIMDRQVNHMVRLVDDLLEVARITQGKIELRKELTELSAVIGSAVEISRPLIESAGHQLAVSLAAESLVVEADPMRVAQVISNLLNNAAKYTPKGGQIWLTVKEENRRACVSVRDNGQGIPAEMLPRVFDMFAQVDQHPNIAKSGLGIGLALAQRLIQMHGGSVEAFSGGIGKGSEFVVRLPLSHGVAQVRLPAKQVRGEAGVRLPSRRILVVDDTHASAYMLGKLLEAMDQEVTITEDASAAVVLARNLRPHLIISDIAMPQMDGYELARQLRSEPGLEDAVLVALTGYGHDKDRHDALEAGFDYHLVKPVSIEELETLLISISESPVPDHVPRVHPV